VAATFGLGVATVVKWWQRYRTTGDVAAKPRGGSKARALLVDVQDWVLERVAAEPHVTTRALAGELAERGIAVSQAPTPDAKKTVHASEQDRLLTSRAAGCVGERIRTGLIRGGWCSSMRPGPRPNGASAHPAECQRFGLTRLPVVAGARESPHGCAAPMRGCGV